MLFGEGFVFGAELGEGEGDDFAVFEDELDGGVLEAAEGGFDFAALDVGPGAEGGGLLGGAGEGQPGGDGEDAVMRWEMGAHLREMGLRVGGVPCNGGEVTIHSLSLIAISLLCCGCGRLSVVAEDKGCVWVAESGRGGKVFLCGTIHLLRESDYPLPAAYEVAYAAAEELVFELPPGASESPELSRRMQELGMLPADAALQKQLPAEEWKRVSDWATRRGVDPAVMDRMRPWYASLLMVATEYAALGAAADRGVDQFFEERAKKDGKAGSGLETVEQQLALFSGMTGEQEREVLEQTLAEMASVEAEYENMIRAWKQGDLEALQALLFREAERYPDLMESFLNARNRAWVPVLAKVLERGGKAMVLVGAGHLGGEQGVIALLRGKGYEVRRVE